MRENAAARGRHDDTYPTGSPVAASSSNAAGDRGGKTRAANRNVDPDSADRAHGCAECRAMEHQIREERAKLKLAVVRTARRLLVPVLAGFLIGVLVAVLIACIRYSLGDGPERGMSISGLAGSGAVAVVSSMITATAAARRKQRSQRGQEPVEYRHSR